MISCSGCGFVVADNTRECPNCGAVLERPSPPPNPNPVCPKCGKENPVGARFCIHCGKGLTEQVREEAPEVKALEPPAVQAPHPTETRTQPEPASPQPAQPLPTPVQNRVSGAPAPQKKVFPIGLVLGGIAGGILLCAMAVTGYGFLRSLGLVPNETAVFPEPEEATPTAYILPTGTVLNATRPPALILSLTNTVLPTDTQIPTRTSTPRPTATATRSEPSGKIVFSCQMDGETHDQICIINADGTGWRQLTDNGRHNWYASLSPDGQRVVFSSNMSGNNYEIYEISAQGGTPVQLTSRLGGKLYAPEISPDGRKIVFTHDVDGDQTVWIMNRNGSDPRRISPDDGWDPSWSSDGRLILFASLTSNGTVQLFTMNENGAGVRQVTDMSGLVGRSDFSPSGEYVATYAGKYGSRSIYLIPVDDSKPIEYFFPPTSAAPSFSPDGQWMVFTGYIDNPSDFDRGCDLYITRLDDPSEVIQLTDNNYCDWQPRWGP